MADVRMTFPTTEEEIRELRAGDSVTVGGHIIGIRDRTQIRIFDQGQEPPMDLTGALLLHTAPGVRKLGEGRYEKTCIGTPAGLELPAEELLDLMRRFRQRALGDSPATLAAD